MSEVKVDDYIVSFGKAKAALSVAIDQAEALGHNAALTLQQQADAFALASDLGAQKVLLIDAHNRFMAKFSLPNPPSQAIVDEALEKMRELAQIVANNILAEGKLEAVIGIVSSVNELAKPSAPATAGAKAKAGGRKGVAIEAAAVTAKSSRGPQLAMSATTTHWLRQMRKRK